MRIKGSLLVAVLLSLACGGGDGKGITDPNPVAPPVVEVLTGQITGINETVIVADTSALAGQVVNASGATVGAQGFTWTSSDTTVGRVSTAPSLRFIARKAGSTVISFTAFSTSGKPVTASKTVTVAPDTAKTLVLTVPDTIGTGLGFLASAVVRGINGATMAASVTYSITGSGQMDADNFVVVGATGTVTIGATASGLTASKQVRIGPAPVPIRIILRDANATPLFIKVAVYKAAERWQRVFSAPLPTANVYLNDRVCALGPSTEEVSYSSAQGVWVYVSHVTSPTGASGGVAGQCLVLGRPVVNGQMQGSTTVSGASNRYLSLIGETRITSGATAGVTTTSSGAQTGRTPQGWIDLVTHEIGHALGIIINYDDPERVSVANTSDLRWIGAEAMRQYSLAGGLLAGGVPLSPIYDGHWRGSQMVGEIMSNSGATNTLSAISLGALIDLGYSVNLSKAEPYTVSTGGVAGALISAELFGGSVQEKHEVFTAKWMAGPNGRAVRIKQ